MIFLKQSRIIISLGICHFTSVSDCVVLVVRDIQSGGLKAYI